MPSAIFSLLLLTVSVFLLPQEQAKAQDSFLSQGNTEAFRQVHSRLAEIRVFRGVFKQTKRITLLSRPLVSSGHFIFSADHGLCWKTVSPFPSEMLISPRRIVEKHSGQSHEIGGSHKAIVRSFTNVLLALFSADPEALKKHFSLSFHGSTKAWKSVLTPSDSLVRHALKQITLSGSHFLERIELEEAQGDSTTIEFTKLELSPPELTANEGACFDF